MRTLRTLKMSLKFIDIGANLTDPMFRGIYGRTQKHPDDLEFVLKRSWAGDVDRMIITVGTLNEADDALAMAAKDDRLYVTMGCHPTRCREFLPNPEQYYQGLREKILQNRSKIVAIGECGLDYDRLHFCDKDTQRIYFERQLSLAEEFQLPLFLHCRNSHEDFMQILERNREKLQACGGGVVHSFTGSPEEAKEIVAFGGLYISLNGCSLKTAENLLTVKDIPNDRIMLETDCPWCGIRQSHAGSKYLRMTFSTVKKKEKWSPEALIDGRSEPCQIRQVLDVVAGVKGESHEKLAETFYANTMQLFFKAVK